MLAEIFLCEEQDICFSDCHSESLARIKFILVQPSSSVPPPDFLPVTP